VVFLGLWGEGGGPLASLFRPSFLWFFFVLFVFAGVSLVVGGFVWG